MAEFDNENIFSVAEEELSPKPAKISDHIPDPADISESTSFDDAESGD